MVLEIQGRVIIYPLQDKEGIYQLLAYLSKIMYNTSKQKITQNFSISFLGTSLLY